MAKLYWTKDIKKLIEDKIDRDSGAIIRDKDLSSERVTRFVNEIRVFQKYAYELIEEMEEADRKDDEREAAWKAKQEAEKNGTAT